MSAMEELMQAAPAPEKRRAEALRVLRGDAGQEAEVDPGPEPYLTLREIGAAIGCEPLLPVALAGAGARPWRPPPVPAERSGRVPGERRSSSGARKN